MNKFISQIQQKFLHIPINTGLTIPSSTPIVFIKSPNFRLFKTRPLVLESMTPVSPSISKVGNFVIAGVSNKNTHRIGSSSRQTGSRIIDTIKCGDCGLFYINRTRNWQ